MKVRVNGNVIDGVNFVEKEANEMNEKEVMENNEEMAANETEENLNDETGEIEHEYTIEDLEEARRIRRKKKEARKVKRILKKVAIGVTCGAVVCGAAMLIVKKHKKGERVDVDSIREDVKDVIEGVVE